MAYLSLLMYRIKVPSFRRVVHRLRDGNPRFWREQCGKTLTTGPDMEMHSALSLSNGAPAFCALGQEQSITFKDLQRIQDIEKAQEALLFLKSNMEILGELKQYHMYATSYLDFLIELKTSCKAYLAVQD
ncbi:hypothetical protein CC86DRAFT_410527 [Ophiobolus disseminans]|uniref:Uncharacterized protein n=1 Tax=Ophiobolus disseminans TaxID=1469910 RepID=A0A6A6ZMY4_9PLEO|nr:hypothetical protein CC86DRAFT_410527 [Ophiobolus disseminans]